VAAMALTDSPLEQILHPSAVVLRVREGFLVTFSSFDLYPLDLLLATNFQGVPRLVLVLLALAQLFLVLVTFLPLLVHRQNHRDLKKYFFFKIIRMKKKLLTKFFITFIRQQKFVLVQRPIAIFTITNFKVQEIIVVTKKF
jgi:hypothetical protein